MNSVDTFVFMCIGLLMDMMSTHRSSKNGSSSNTLSTTLKADTGRLPHRRPRELQARPLHQERHPLRATQHLRRLHQRDWILVFGYCERT